ncbi:hypothetical protein SLS62_000035 [Diatrype stigma]|uniref:DhaK domain-containing protein n=1 Tax=Diatrype stigma TaxID=117547 RepID=A0AAN9VCL7_9PEZI
MSSLIGLGFSATLFKVLDDQFVKLLDMAVAANGWLPPAPTEDWTRGKPQGLASMEEVGFGAERTQSNLQVDHTQNQDVTAQGLKNVIDAEPEVTQYDTLVGEGDDAVQLVANIAHVVEKSMDGTSGVLYAIYINELAHGPREQDWDSAVEQPRPAMVAIWAQAVGASERGCDSTKGMQADLGRSIYVGGEGWRNCPDPGRNGLFALLKGFVG